MHILKRQRYLKRGLRWAFVLTLASTLFWLGFTRLSYLDTVQRDGVLKAVVMNDPRHFNPQTSTFEVTFARAFANHLGVELQLHTVDSFDDMQKALRLGFADMAIGGLGIPDAPTDIYGYSRPYMEALQQVVYKRTTVRSPEDLPGLKGAVRVGGAQYRAAQTLKQEYPDLDLVPLAVNTDELIKRLAQGEFDYAVIDSNDHAFYQPFYPNLRHAFDITEPRPVGWMFRADRDTSLRDAADDFINTQEQSGQLHLVLDRYFGHLREFDYVGIRLFERHVTSRLPALLDDFQGAADQYGLDWRLLAAVGYQESHWRPRAVSPTGVRGVMMLTLRTAGDLGVTNRLNPTQSIYGGAQYLAAMHSRVPERITDPDRMWFALAAYNVGMGHLEDARRIAERLGHNPDYWIEVREVLPYLRDPDYYRFTRFGFARGDEPVIYVQNIRRYYDLLRWMFPTDGELNGASPELQPGVPGISLPPLL
ncbi:membrane-bound lytic murein transglycosylase MltF [Salinispirillum sp. LH 10-3-1]|uniref:Membrane-bound lytic murein transglycosylase F n=1 Tax=Salinispirillum sp. LH 10-3-1 TaxID=2952525 RepID=A0AB38YHP5_9GAMM